MGQKKKWKDIHQIRDEKQAKAYLHPVRMRILQFLSREAMTISQVAEILKVHPANLTHHFRKLLEANLIELVEERDTGRVVEKYYLSIAFRFQVREENVSMKGGAQYALYLLQQDMAAAQSKLRENEKQVICLLDNIPLSRKSFAVFQKKMEKLMSEFRKEGKAIQKSQNEKKEHYSLSLGLYPREPGSFASERNDAKPVKERNE